MYVRPILISLNKIYWNELNFINSPIPRQAKFACRGHLRFPNNFSKTPTHFTENVVQ